MKKIIALILALVILAICMVVFSSCGNKQLFDTNYTFNYAYISGLNEDGSVKRVPISSWKDYDGEQLQIKATDGTVYIVSSYNCILAYEQ